MHWFLDPITKHYADFSGRATRQEYWMFMLTSIIFGFILFLLPILVSLSVSGGGIGLGLVLTGIVFLVIVVSVVGLMVPSIAIQVRRLHDIGMSGWWWFIALVPLFGSIAMIIFMCLPSKPGTNQYGPNKYEPTSGPIPTPPVPPTPAAFTPYTPPTFPETTPAVPTQELPPQANQSAPVVGYTSDKE